MNGLELLKRDHQRLLFLINEFERKVRNTREGELETNRDYVKTFSTLSKTVTEHTKIEERMLFPALEKFIETRSVVDECCREHQRIGEMLGKLQKIIKAEPPNHWDNLVFELHEKIQSHIVKEEDWLFPRAESLLGDAQLEDLFFAIEQTRSDQSETDSLIFPADRFGVRP